MNESTQGFGGLESIRPATVIQMIDKQLKFYTDKAEALRILKAKVEADPELENILEKTRGQF